MKKTISTGAFIIAAFALAFANTACNKSEDSYTANNRQSTNISANSTMNRTNAAANNSAPMMNSAASPNTSNR